MEAYIIKTALGIIGFLLVLMGGDFYRRLFSLKERVKTLEEKMTAFELSQALASRDLSQMRSEASKAASLAENKILPTLQELATTVAVLNDRLQRHMNGGNNEGS